MAFLQAPCGAVHHPYFTFTDDTPSRIVKGCKNAKGGLPALFPLVRVRGANPDVARPRRTGPIIHCIRLPGGYIRLRRTFATLDEQPVGLPLISNATHRSASVNSVHLVAVPTLFDGVCCLACWLLNLSGFPLTRNFGRSRFPERLAYVLIHQPPRSTRFASQCRKPPPGLVISGVETVSRVPVAPVLATLFLNLSACNVTRSTFLPPGRAHRRLWSFPGWPCRPIFSQVYRYGMGSRHWPPPPPRWPKPFITNSAPQSGSPGKRRCGVIRRRRVQ